VVLPLPQGARKTHSQSAGNISETQLILRGDNRQPAAAAAAAAKIAIIVVGNA
jgi:hypothetical protein